MFSLGKLVPPSRPAFYCPHRPFRVWFLIVAKQLTTFTPCPLIGVILTSHGLCVTVMAVGPKSALLELVGYLLPLNPSLSCGSWQPVKHSVITEPNLSYIRLEECW